MKLSETTLNELNEQLPNLLEYFSYSERAADYICCFCGTRAKTNTSLITHDPDCLGIRLQQELQNESK